MPNEEKEVDSVAVPPPPSDAAQSKKKTIILIVVLVIVGLALAAGISLFVVTKVMGDLPAGGDEEGGAPRYHDAGVFIKLGDPKEGILVNVGGARSSKFLKATIIAEFNPGKKSVINEDTHGLYPDAEVKVNDVATQFLRGCSLEDFDAEKQEDFKKQLKDALNMALGAGAVYDVYVTSFLLQ